MSVNRAMKTRVSALSLAFIAALISCLVCFPGIAFAVCPAPGSEAEANGRGCPSHTGELVTLDDINASHPAPVEDSAPLRLYAQVEGSGSAQAAASDKKTLPLLIIVVGFNDTPYRNDFDWGNIIFKGNDSLAAYYDDMSLGKFTFEPMNETSAYGVDGNTNEKDIANDGIVHVTLGMAHDEWGDFSEKPEHAATLGLALVNALTAADEYVDFASYDTDGDGVLETNEVALGFVIAGYEAAMGSNVSQFGAAKCLWSHAWKITSLLSYGKLSSSYFPTLDGTKVNSYIAIAEQENANTRSSIGTLAHELGHYLGLPDLYDTEYSGGQAWSQYDVYMLCLMNFGSWGRTSDGKSIPTAISAPCRLQLGWITPIELSDGDSLLISPQDFNATPNESGYVCARIKIDGSDDEYYLIEDRRYSGWDEALQPIYQAASPSGGLVFWHIDAGIYEKDPYGVNNGDHRPWAMPLFIEKDANSDYAIIGSSPNTMLAFFDEETWNSQYAMTLGDYLTLPKYGTDPNDDVPSARTLSQLHVYFTYADNGSVLIGLGFKPCNHVLEHCAAVAPTCETAGSIEHWKCSRCGALFSDSTGKNEIQPSEIAQSATGHRLVHVEGKPATSTADGVREHWICDVCQKLFADSAATQVISPSDTVIPASEDPAKKNNDATAPASEDTSKEKNAAALSSADPEKSKKGAAIPASGDPLQPEAYAVLIGCSLALLSVCLLRRRFRSG